MPPFPPGGFPPPGAGFPLPGGSMGGLPPSFVPASGNASAAPSGGGSGPTVHPDRMRMVGGGGGR